VTADDSRVTIHVAASLDGFIARRDGSVDWLATAEEFEEADGRGLLFVTDALPVHRFRRALHYVRNVVKPQSAPTLASQAGSSATDRRIAE